MITQSKTGKEIWVPLSKETLDLIDGLERTSTYLVVSEETGVLTIRTRSVGSSENSAGVPVSAM